MWITQPLERKKADGSPSGLWHLTASSDEGGCFSVGCDHDHATADEAQDCVEAKIKIGQVTGFPYRDRSAEAEAAAQAKVKHMVDRFLAWKLPENFNPDAGISFKPEFNEQTAHPTRHQPTGTNLFDARQAEAMIRHMLDGLPA